ncbi:hypothetical protein CAOG_01564 [Capsaspora owczarzaki ATCC 30864]|uniref:Kinetochore protein SPC25 n=1 Tax=Capsaspora owczarzaki (strain ATCC 30864) TaxID=595528 RepID=A0A0D2WKP7_CAPO3|nr:hypothetical protein CAOG_01564 [Capsaspora owczarzaki ATCC 30864]KJE90223.1 hypothetical protein CAOG_001564 [Capsaspora owczarzaki ATCC 30864]|eukprot:XP_004364432.1 hypothetical protein CAOG_01564 [Capsaspora owczarzaki ATCC 30864]
MQSYNMERSLEQLQEDMLTAARMVDNWADSQLKEMRHAQLRHTKTMEDDKENAAKLQASLKQLGEHSEAGQILASQQAAEIALSRSAVSQLQQQKELAMDTQNDIRQQIAAREQALVRETEMLSERERDAATSMKELTRGVQFFSERLGLKIQRTGKHHLQFIFRYIDPYNVNREFSFSVRIDEKNMYHVDVCEPMVEDLAGMVAQLNDDNQLSVFIKNIRKKFKAMV